MKNLLALGFLFTASGVAAEAPKAIPWLFRGGRFVEDAPARVAKALKANVVTSTIDSVVGRKTNSWLDVLNIGGGDLDTLLMEADNRMLSIENVLKNPKLISEAVDNKDAKLQLALNPFRHAVRDDVVGMLSFLPKEYVARSEDSGLSAVIRNAIANREVPLDHAVSAIENRIDGMQKLRGLYEKLPKAQQISDVATAMKHVENELTRALAEFNRQLKEEQLLTPKRRLQAEDFTEEESTEEETTEGETTEEEDDDSEKQLLGMVSDIMSSAMTAKKIIGSGSSAVSSSGSGLSSLFDLNNIGNKVIKDSIDSTIMKQVSKATGIDANELRNKLKQANSNGQGAFDQLKRLIDSITKTVKLEGGTSPKAIKDQITALGKTLREKLGSASDLVKMLTEEATTEAPESGDKSKTDKKLLDAIDALENIFNTEDLDATAPWLEYPTSPETTEFTDMPTIVEVAATKVAEFPTKAMGAMKETVTKISEMQDAATTWAESAGAAVAEGANKVVGGVGGAIEALGHGIENIGAHKVLLGVNVGAGAEAEDKVPSFESDESTEDSTEGAAYEIDGNIFSKIGNGLSDSADSMVDEAANAGAAVVDSVTSIFRKQLLSVEATTEAEEESTEAAEETTDAEEETTEAAEETTEAAKETTEGADETTDGAETTNDVAADADVSSASRS